MRKFGYLSAAFGATAAVILFLVRQTRWFAAQQAQTMSEPAELVESAFWASLIVLVIGLLLFALSFRRSARQADDIAAPAPLEPEPWVCPRCGSMNPDAEPVCAACGLDRRGPQAREWVCPRCGGANGPEDRFCAFCGCGRPF